uniref:Uncharacterized protein n=1 Tax=Sinorhizobium meliloti (strain SM11) TaxID=707241 RepID=A4KVE8_SINMM|nr:hypothetical protein [Sinorhizobium meliloti SM11]
MLSLDLRMAGSMVLKGCEPESISANSYVPANAYLLRWL